MAQTSTAIPAAEAASEPPRHRPEWVPTWSKPAALRALRAVIVMPVLFALTYKGLGNLQIALFAAFGDLYQYVGEHASPDHPAEDEARIVTRAGTWAGRVLLGEAVGTAIVAAAPVTVRVCVPAELDRVLGWPLELAYAGGVPLAARGDVTLVYDAPAQHDAGARQGTDRGRGCRRAAGHGR